MHLHGYKLEILEVFAPKLESNCNLAKCDLPDVFDDANKIEALKRIPERSRPLKDTFIMPAGGAVATRIFTRRPAPWFAHCHMEIHRQDGMAFIMNVGNYSSPSDGSWLPDDFPSCETPFHKSKAIQPHCDCFIDHDAVLGLTLDEAYKCSREYSCSWQQSQVAALRPSKTNKSFVLQSSHRLPGSIISLIFVCIVIMVTVCFTFIMPRFTTSKKLDPEEPLTFLPKVGIDDSYFWLQFHTLLPLRWQEYKPTTINILRVVEVVGLGLITGLLFQNVGNNSTATGLAEKTSLLFFSTTLWCQTRMYPAISNYFEFKEIDLILIKEYHYDLLPILLSRMVVVNACESWWPFLFVFCAYPLASMFGSLSKVLTITLFLMLNNICYISIGGLLGTVMPTISLGMIGATLFAQSTVICAGFFTKLPSFIAWFRYISPIFYAFKGIVKTAYNWDDVYDCHKGNSAAAVTECFVEENAAIDDYKERGINVATFGDPTSSQVHIEMIMMCVLFIFCQISMACFFKFVLLRRIELTNKLSSGNTITKCKSTKKSDVENGVSDSDVDSVSKPSDTHIMDRTSISF